MLGRDAGRLLAIFRLQARFDDLSEAYDVAAATAALVDDVRGEVESADIGKIKALGQEVVRNVVGVLVLEGPALHIVKSSRKVRIAGVTELLDLKLQGLARLILLASSIVWVVRLQMAGIGPPSKAVRVDVRDESICLFIRHIVSPSIVALAGHTGANELLLLHSLL